MVIEGGEETLGGIFTSGIWNVFACSSTTRGVMDKRRPRRDSAHQIGPETSFHTILMVVVLIMMHLDALRYSDAVPHHDAVPYHDTVRHYTQWVW